MTGTLGLLSEAWRTLALGFQCVDFYVNRIPLLCFSFLLHINISTRAAFFILPMCKISEYVRDSEKYLRETLDLIDFFILTPSTFSLLQGII